jgi:hypothetical protein
MDRLLSWHAEKRPAPVKDTQPRAISASLLFIVRSLGFWLNPIPRGGKWQGLCYTENALQHTLLSCNGLWHNGEGKSGSLSL